MPDGGSSATGDAHADVVSVPQCDAIDHQSLATFHFTPTQLALDDAYVYWAEADAIRRVSKKKGGTPQILGLRTVTPWPLLQVFALDTSNVYFAADALLRVPKGGGTPTPLGLDTTAALVAVGGSSTFAWEWQGDGTLYRLPTNGGAPAIATKSLPSDTNALAVEGDVAYGSSEHSGTFVVHLAVGTIDKLDATESFNLVLDDTYAYFTTGDPGPIGSNAVMRVPKSGGQVEQVVNAAYAFSVALDGDTLYFTDILTKQILRVSKNGGPASVFETVEPQESPMGSVVVDERCIYWTSNLGGIMVAPKP